MNSLQSCNTSFNATLNPYMCPLWPEMPALESEPVPLAANTNSFFDTIKDYMPKSRDEVLASLVDGYIVKECLADVPYSCAGALAAKILPPAKLSETAIISPRGHHLRTFLRFAAYRIDFYRHIHYLRPCVLRTNLPSCVKYHIDGGKSYAIKLAEKGQMPGWGTVPLFLFKEILHLKAVETALSCAFETWTECITNTAQLLIGIKSYRFFAEE